MQGIQEISLLSRHTAPIKIIDDQPARSHYFFRTQDAPALSTILAKPYQHFIEIGAYHEQQKTLRFIEEERPHFSLCISSANAFSQPVADHVVHYLTRRRPLLPMLASDIQTCLQEALMNAIIHGNLMLQCHPETHEFEHYLEMITHRLKYDPAGQKPVQLYGWFTERHITLCVVDSGSGFDLHQPDPPPEKPYGRGLALIRAMSSSAWQSKPNHVSMRFDCHA